MTDVFKVAYKNLLGTTPVDTLVRKTYAKFFKNDVLRVLYYRQMNQIFDRVLREDSHCVDIGCHEGNVLADILQRAPRGRHTAFEPIPERSETLQKRFPNVEIHPIALSDSESEAVFHYVRDCDALSGLKQREYPSGTIRVEPIRVRTAPLDRMLSPELPIRLVKLDVEGAELQVLRGARETLLRWKPFTIFQHGKGSAEFYGATPAALFDLFRSCDMHVSLMEHWLKGRPALTQAQFVRQFQRRSNYIFVAHASHLVGAL